MMWFAGCIIFVILAFFERCKNVDLEQENKELRNRIQQLKAENAREQD